MRSSYNHSAKSPPQVSNDGNKPNLASTIHDRPVGYNHSPQLSPRNDNTFLRKRQNQLAFPTSSFLSFINIFCDLYRDVHLLILNKSFGDRFLVLKTRLADFWFKSTVDECYGSHIWYGYLGLLR